MRDFAHLASPEATGLEQKAQLATLRAENQIGTTQQETHIAYIIRKAPKARAQISGLS